MSLKSIAFASAALVFASATLALGTPMSASAQTVSDQRFALGAGIGTDGGTILGEYSLSPQFVLRGQGSFLDFDHDFNSSDVHYHGKLKSNLGGAFLDWHPASNAFFLSAGVDAGERHVDVTATPNSSASITLNGVTYTSSQIGSVAGRVRYADTSPVLTLGWDNTFDHAGHWGFRAQAGVLFAGDPSTHLTAYGPYASDPTVQSNLRQEEQSLDRDARDFRYYPVVSAALTYRF